MTVFYGVNSDKLLVDTPRALTNPGESGGKKNVIYDQYVFAAAITTTDTLRMGAKIPAGARILDVKLVFPDLGSTGAFNIGWLVSDDAVEVADPDGFAATLDVNTAAGSYSMFTSQSAVAGMGKKFASPVQAVIAPSTNTTATSGTIQLWIEYILN